MLHEKRRKVVDERRGEGRKRISVVAENETERRPERMICIRGKDSADSRASLSYHTHTHTPFATQF